MSITTQDVLFEERSTASGQKLGIITLNIEKTLNSLNLDMVEAMLATVKDWRERSDIACLFITAAGEKAFCAGGDVQALYRSATEQPGDDAPIDEHHQDRVEEPPDPASIRLF